MKSLHYAQIFVRNISRPVLMEGLRRAFSRWGFVPFDPSRIPPHYEERSNEVLWLAISEPDKRGVGAVIFKEWYRGFRAALETSKEVRGYPIVAIVRPPLEAPRIKVYEDGEVVLKVGSDPDEELLYHPQVSSPDSERDFVERWLSERADLLTVLASCRLDCTYERAVSGAWPLALSVCCFIDSTSRLYLES